MAPSSPRLLIRTWIVLPAAALGALILHIAISKDRPPGEIRLYNYFLCGFLAGGLVAATLQLFWKRLHRSVEHMAPIVAAAIVLLALWELITTGLHWLPLPYFPGPAAVLQSLIHDWRLLVDSTWHSLILLLG